MVGRRALRGGARGTCCARTIPGTLGARTFITTWRPARHAAPCSAGRCGRPRCAPVAPAPRAPDAPRAPQTRFYAAGRLLSGPDRLSFYIALACTLLPLSTFWSAVLPWLIEHYPRWAIPLQVISVYAILFALVNLFITAFMDPGILPRRPDPSHGNPLSKKKPPSTQKVSVNGVKQRVKFCDTCNLYRPPRATHCSICDNCVDRFDHHCPWVGNCVGRRNYRFFLLFVLGVSFNCVRRRRLLLLLLRCHALCPHSLDTRSLPRRCRWRTLRWRPRPRTRRAAARASWRA